MLKIQAQKKYALTNALELKNVHNLPCSCALKYKSVFHVWKHPMHC